MDYVDSLVGIKRRYIIAIQFAAELNLEIPKSDFSIMKRNIFQLWQQEWSKTRNIK